MNKLYIMVGISGSGKTTKAQELKTKLPGSVYISSDAIRKELWGSEEDQSDNEKVFRVAKKRIGQALDEEKDIIFDATNLTMKARRTALDVFKKDQREKYEVAAVVVNTPYEECIKRDCARKRSVTKEIIDRQVRSFQIPIKQEGINTIMCTQEPGLSVSQKELLEKFREFDQETIHHLEPLLDHCLRLKELFEIRYPEHAFAALYHDVGKLFSKTYDETGQAHYYGHENIGAYFLLTHKFTDLDLDFQRLVEEEIPIVNYHMMPFGWVKEKTLEKKRMLFGNDFFELLMYFNECDRAAAVTGLHSKE